jgi:phage shock protein E
MNDKIDAVKIKEEVKAGKSYLLDVRSEEEFAQFSLPDSINLSVEDIEYGKVPSLPRDSKVYVYCMSGGRAEKAVSMLKMMGFTNTINAGGIMNLI